jgi:membrane protein implicated in regulation of membrane protease activity
MEFLVPLMPLFGALPIAVAAVVIARMWLQRRDLPAAHLEAQNEELRGELEAMRHELRETQERLDFTERVLTQQGRAESLPAADAERRRETR